MCFDASFVLGAFKYVCRAHIPNAILAIISDIPLFKLSQFTMTMLYFELVTGTNCTIGVH